MLVAELVGVQDITDLPAWVPRIIGAAHEPEGLGLLEITTLLQPLDAFNFGHESCEYCSYKLTENLESTARFNPHLADVFSRNPDRKSVEEHCRCSCVQEYACQEGAYRYTVRVDLMHDKQMSLMRGRLQVGEALDVDCVNKEE